MRYQFASNAPVAVTRAAIIEMEAEALSHRVHDASCEYGDYDIDPALYARYGYFSTAEGPGDGWQWTRWRDEVAKKYGLAPVDAEAVMNEAVAATKR